jgi:hypothetical protein
MTTDGDMQLNMFSKPQVGLIWLQFFSGHSLLKYPQLMGLLRSQETVFHDYEKQLYQHKTIINLWPLSHTTTFP